MTCLELEHKDKNVPYICFNCQTMRDIYLLHRNPFVKFDENGKFKKNYPCAREKAKK